MSRDLDGKVVTVAVDEGRFGLPGAAPYPWTTARRLVVAVSLKSVDSTVQRLTLLITALGLVVLLLVTASLAWLLSGQGCVRSREWRPRPRRSPPGPDPAGAAGAARTEVGRLSDSLNGMLHQIENAFRGREASEAGCDVRRRRQPRAAQPVTRSVAMPTVRQGAVTEPEEQARALGRIETESVRMGVLVDDLLLLARLDQQRPIDANRSTWRSWPRGGRGRPSGRSGPDVRARAEDRARGAR